MVQFTKQAKSNQEHLQAWQDRGLIIPNLARADRYLSFIGYYRLSAYTIPFQQIVTTPSTVLHQFKANTTFDDVLNLYIFDRELRLLIMDAIERIEVAIRAQICNVLCHLSGNAFWYTDEQHFNHSMPTCVCLPVLNDNYWMKKAA